MSETNVMIKKYGIIGGAVLGGILLLVLVFGAIGVNDEGYYTIKQSLMGQITVISDPGPYLKLYGKTKVYPVSFEVYLSSSDLDGGDGASTQAVKVIFNDGSFADLSSLTKVTVPNDDIVRKRIHTDYKSASTFQSNVRQYIEAIQKRSGSMFKAEEAYASKRTQLENIVDSQLREGKYATEAISEQEATSDTDENGNPITVTVKRTIVALDTKNQPIIEDEGLFNQYDLIVNYFNLKDVEPDDVTKRLIEQKKLAEQQRIVAQTEAEKSKQDAITATEKGKADIAIAKAREEVAKISAVTQAEKQAKVAELNAERELTVATLNAQKAIQNANAVITAKEAEARSAKLLVSAGLTPMQKAKWDYDTKVGVANAIFKNYKVPEIMITGGDGGGANPLDAIAINQLMDIMEKMNK